MPFPLWLESPTDTPLGLMSSYVRIRHLRDDLSEFMWEEDLLYAEHGIMEFLDEHLFHDGITCSHQVTLMGPSEERAWLQTHLDCLLQFFLTHQMWLEDRLKNESDEAWLPRLALSVVALGSGGHNLRWSTVDAVATDLEYLLGPPQLLHELPMAADDLIEMVLVLEHLEYMDIFIG